MVDEADRPVGLATRAEVHQRGLFHRAVHILVFDPAGRLYLQKRAAAKDTWPGRWISSASGHVDPGEDYDQAARRELAEELGLALPLSLVGRLPASSATENEFTAVYRAVTDQPPQPNPEEIAEGRFFTPAAAWDLAQRPDLAVPSLAAILKLAELSI